MIAHYHKLIYFLPIALATGPFLPDLIVVICSILFLIDTFRLKLFKYFNNDFFKVFLIFLFLLNLSSFFSINYMSFKYTLGYLRFGVFSIFVYFVLVNFNKSKIFLSYSIIFTFVFLIIDALIQLLFGKNIFLFDLQYYRDHLFFVTSIFNEEKKLGSYLSRLFPILLISYIFIKEKISNSKIDLYFSIVIILTCSIILLTTERVSIFLISIFLLIVFFKSKIFLKPKINHLFFFSLIIFVLLYFFPGPYEKIKSILYSTGILFPGYTEDGRVFGEYEVGKFIYSKFHHDQILVSFKLFLDNPFFGIGAKNFKITGGWHPHNYHAQILAETGLLCYLILISVFFYCLFKTIFAFLRPLNTNDEIKLYLFASFCLSLTPIPNGDFFNNWLNIIMFFPVGYYLFINEK